MNIRSQKARPTPASAAAVLAIRAKVPFGPHHMPHINELARQHGLHPDYVRVIAEHRAHNRTPIRERLKDGKPRPKSKKTTPRGRSKQKLKQALGIAQEWRCAYCQKDISKHPSVDHIIPLAQGGPDLRDNLQLTCRTCNKRKRELSDKEFRQVLNRLQKAATRTSVKPTSYNSRITTCTCHIHGCYPDCMGCELCQHLPWEAPERLACPDSDNPPAVCQTPGLCAAQRACSRIPNQKPHRRSRPWTLDQHRSFQIRDNGTGPETRPAPGTAKE